VRSRKVPSHTRCFRSRSLRINDCHRVLYERWLDRFLTASSSDGIPRGSIGRGPLASSSDVMCLVRASQPEVATLIVTVNLYFTSVECVMLALFTDRRIVPLWEA
jgi:hypothetical protein